MSGGVLNLNEDVRCLTRSQGQSPVTETDEHPHVSNSLTRPVIVITYKEQGLTDNAHPNFEQRVLYSFSFL